MKIINQQLNKNSNQLKAMYWGKLLTITGGAQAIVQITGLLSGILIIRLLSVNEYALYTLANTMLGAMTILSDAGISTGVMAEGGKVWKDKDKLGKVLATGLHLRKKFAILSSMICVPITLYLLRHHGASWFNSFLIILALLPAFLSSLSDSLLSIIPKLHQDITPLQRNQIAVSVQRLFLNTVTLLIFPWASIAIMANSIPRIYGNIRLKSIAKKFTLIQQPEEAIEKEILVFVKRILPGAIYYSFSGQITIWLVSILGSTNSLAELGALSRITTVFTFLTSLFSTLVVPRFARLPNNKNQIIIFFIRYQVILGVVNIIIIIGFYAFSKYILIIMGHNYQTLNYELVLVAISSAVGVMNQAIYQLLSSRGMIMHPILSISFSLFIQSILLFILTLHDVRGYVLYSIFTAASIYITRLAYFYFYHKMQ